MGRLSAAGITIFGETYHVPAQKIRTGTAAAEEPPRIAGRWFVACNWSPSLPHSASPLTHSHCNPLLFRNVRLAAAGNILRPRPVFTCMTDEW